MHHNSEVEHVDVNGLRIAYTRAGSGPSLVMLHGAPSPQFADTLAAFVAALDLEQQSEVPTETTVSCLLRRQFSPLAPSTHRNSSCSPGSAMPVWSRTPRPARWRSASS